MIEEDDSDNDSDESDEDSEEEVAEVNFIDIAQRPSTVMTDVPPSRLIQFNLRLLEPKRKDWIGGCVLFKAVLDDDFEAFVQIADLYKSLPKPLDLPVSTVAWILTHDRPTMLDELIRRSGTGIELPSESEDHHEEDEVAGEAKPKKLSPKTYLGLNVHGKKRKDLVAKSDPNAPSAPWKPHELPLVWRAAHKGAIGCIQYLATERAHSAYQYYASTHSDDRAQYLKRINGQISQRIGWTLNQLNESVITPAVIGNNLDALKTVIDLQPAQLQTSIMARYGFHSSSRAAQLSYLGAGSTTCASTIFWLLPTGDARRRCSIICCLRGSPL